MSRYRRNTTHRLRPTLSWTTRRPPGPTRAVPKPRNVSLPIPPGRRPGTSAAGATALPTTAIPKSNANSKNTGNRSRSACDLHRWNASSRTPPFWPWTRPKSPMPLPRTCAPTTNGAPFVGGRRSATTQQHDDDPHQPHDSDDPY